MGFLVKQWFILNVVFYQVYTFLVYVDRFMIHQLVLVLISEAFFFFFLTQNSDHAEVKFIQDKINKLKLEQHTLRRKNTVFMTSTV